MSTTTPKTKKDTSNFFKTATHEEEYWEKYLAARPKYSNEFYTRVLDYHRSHQKSASAQPSVAHDVGTGPGQVAAILAETFDRVIASDLNESHLSVAAKRLNLPQDDASESKIVLQHLGAENLHSSYPPASASFIAVAECMALLDAEKAMESWSTVLAPGGTLAIWFYGRPYFVEAEGYDAKACQDIYDQIADASFGKAIKSGNATHRAAWKRATDCMTSFLDNVHLSPEQWTDVRRWKWNSDHDLSFYGPAACDFEIDVVNRVQPDETVEDVRDPSFWSESWSVQDWRLFLKMNLPVFKEHEDEDAAVEGLWRALEEKMGGTGARRTTSWPVVAILATRK